MQRHMWLLETQFDDGEWAQMMLPPHDTRRSARCAVRNLRRNGFIHRVRIAKYVKEAHK
jgi:hypothetical protein